MDGMTNTQSLLFKDTEKELAAQVLEYKAKLTIEVEALKDANELCRSAHSIASRKGIQTNWEAFTDQLNVSLDIQFKALAKTEGMK